MDDEAKLEYIASLLRELQGMAKDSNLHFLGYLIEMAVMESQMSIAARKRRKTVAA